MANRYSITSLSENLIFDDDGHYLAEAPNTIEAEFGIDEVAGFSYLRTAKDASNLLESVDLDSSKPVVAGITSGTDNEDYISHGRLFPPFNTLAVKNWLVSAATAACSVPFKYYNTFPDPALIAPPVAWVHQKKAGLSISAEEACEIAFNMARIAQDKLQIQRSANANYFKNFWDENA